MTNTGKEQMRLGGVQRHCRCWAYERACPRGRYDLGVCGTLQV